MPVLESSIERRCVEIAENNGCLLLKIEKRRGWPDRMLMAPNGKLMFIEFKKVGSSLMPMQKYVHEQLRTMNFSIEEVDNYTLFLALIHRLKGSSLSSGSPKLFKKEVQNG
jgi:hypothetical protein